ncbi:ABC transporter permease [Apibacter muscae]|uniref:ABC transporter permease n=1 Tax=Apibacter muscae TaxID=2509004 RepID=UPI0011ABE629|nr:ABC transporter permease [Apibacter muscae]TWP23312.1 ABC transporter permease [Apibacter muscae]
MLKKIFEYLATIGNSFTTELKLIFSDSAAYTTYIITPLIVGFVYTYVYSNEIITKVSIAVVDQNQSQLSHKVIRMLDASQQVEVTHNSTSIDQAKELYNQGKIDGILFIPSNFSSKIQQGQVATISAYYDASYMLYYKQMKKAVVTAVGTLSAQVEVSKLMSSGLTQTEATSARRSVQPISISLFNINSGYATFLMPVVFIIALQLVQLTTIGVLGGTQREKGNFEKTYPFISKPLGSLFIVLGRSGAYGLISTLIIILQMGLVVPIFDLPHRGNPWEAILFLLPFFLAVCFLGIFLMNLFKKREDAVMVITLSSIPALFLCGLSWPKESFPKWIEIISIFSPSTLGSRGFIAINQYGATLSEIKPIWFNLWGVALFYFILAVLSMKRIYYYSKKR